MFYNSIYNQMLLSEVVTATTSSSELATDMALEFYINADKTKKTDKIPCTGLISDSIMIKVPNHISYDEQSSSIQYKVSTASNGKYNVQKVTEATTTSQTGTPTTYYEITYNKYTPSFKLFGWYVTNSGSGSEYSQSLSSKQIQKLQTNDIFYYTIDSSENFKYLSVKMTINKTICKMYLSNLADFNKYATNGTFVNEVYVEDTKGISHLKFSLNSATAEWREIVDAAARRQIMLLNSKIDNLITVAPTPPTDPDNVLWYDSTNAGPGYHYLTNSEYAEIISLINQHKPQET